MVFMSGPQITAIVALVCSHSQNSGTWHPGTIQLEPCYILCLNHYYCNMSYMWLLLNMTWNPQLVRVVTDAFSLPCNIADLWVALVANGFQVLFKVIGDLLRRFSWHWVELLDTLFLISIFHIPLLINYILWGPGGNAISVTCLCNLPIAKVWFCGQESFEKLALSLSHMAKGLSVW